MKNLNIISFLIIMSAVYSQTVIEGTPYSFQNEVSNTVQDIVMPEFDIDAMLLEDDKASSGAPFRYGKIFDVDYNMDNIGSWEFLPDGGKLWRVRINSPYAYAICLEYDYFYLPKGAEFYIYDASEETILGAYTSANNQDDKLFATPLVKGDSIILEYYEPKSVERSGAIHIKEIIHDYKDLQRFFLNYQNNRDCGINVVCPEAEPYQDLVNAVSWLDMGAYICSGSMLNNVRQDLTPYYMTAWHCTSGDNPSTFRFYFNYETSTCSASWGSYGSYAYGSVSEEDSNGMDSDWDLLRITGNISESWEVYYAGWNKSSSNPIVSCGIHHPNGEPKKINFDDDMATSSGWNNNQPTHWKVYWDEGGSEPGSSGCPVYDDAFRFRGQLSGGPDIPCEGNGAYDLYGKFSRAFSYINEYLDPDNTGVTFINGTYNGIEEIEGCTDPEAENYNPDATIDDGSCTYGMVALTFGNTSSGSFEINMDNSVPIAGFQFTITDNPDLIVLSGASGGAAEENNFTVSTSELGIVIGFSFSGDLIPTGNHLLTNLQYIYNGSGTTDLCITEQTVSDTNGNPLTISENDCIDFEVFEGTLGDINADGTINIQDVVMLLNFILGFDDPDASEFFASDLNSDGILNIQDVISLINIILG